MTTEPSAVPVTADWAVALPAHPLRAALLQEDQQPRQSVLMTPLN